MNGLDFDEMSVSEIRELILENKVEFMAAIEQGKKLFDKFSRTYTADKFIWDVINGIDKQSLQEAKEAERAAVVVSDPEILKKRAEFQADSAFSNRLDPRHKEVHRDWLKTYSEQENGDGETNGELK